MNGILWAGRFAASTTDTFRAVDVFGDLDLHRANLLAFFAIHACAVVNRQLIQTKAVKEPVEGAERAEVFAKRACHDDRSHDNHHKHRHLPTKEHPQAGA